MKTLRFFTFKTFDQCVIQNKKIFFVLQRQLSGTNLRQIFLMTRTRKVEKVIRKSKRLCFSWPASESKTPFENQNNVLNTMRYSLWLRLVKKDQAECNFKDHLHHRSRIT